MAALKLVNNTGLKSEKNLCYVNTELQLLYSTPDVRSFFASKTYRENYQGRLLVCDELSRLFRTEGRFQTSAAELRRLVGQYYRREDICNGVQQDIVEFHTLLLGIIEVELARVGGGHSRFGNKFKGKEQTRRKFLNTPDGCCKQGHVSRTEEESFRVIKIDVPNTNRVISLNNIVSNHFSESTTTFGMKCSECCEHISNCPQTGKCKLKGATSQKFLISTPNILFIQLLRFDDFQGQKNETKITPENILVLPNEDKYKLVSIGNHLGPFINNGHYQALIKVGTSWIKADDTNVMKTNLQTEITGENYIFVYQKFSTTTQFVATNYWEEVFESQPVPPGLHVQLDTRTGKNYAKLLEESCDKKSQDKENDISKKASSSNPVRSSETTKNHLEEENNKTTKKTGKKESRSKVQKCTNVTEPINSRGKCKGCKQEFTDMNNHIKRSFPCQNHYKVVEELNNEDYKHKYNKELQEVSAEHLKTIKKETGSKMVRTKEQGQTFLSCLDSNNWLNDEVINEYMKLVNALDDETFIFTSFFHTAFREGGFKRVKNYYRRYELLDYRELYIPVHKDNHWFLILFNGTDLVAIDPFNYPQSSTQEKKNLLEKNKKAHLRGLSQLEKMYFKPLFASKNKQLTPLSLRVRVPPEIPAQNNSCDCGVFLATLVKYLVLRKEFDFDTESMIGIRKAMKTELEMKKLRIYNEDEVQKAHQSTNEDMEFHTNSDSLDGPSQGLTNKNQASRTVQNDVTNIQYFTFNNFGVDTVFESNGTDTLCLVCMKWFKRIISHLQKTTKCKGKVDFVNFSNAIIDLKKDIKRQKQKVHRESKTNAEKKAEKEAKIKRMKVCRESKTTEEKEIEKKAAASGMKVCRESKTTEEKEIGKKAAASGMKVCRESKTTEEKEIEKKTAAIGMKVCRESKTTEEKEIGKKAAASGMKVCRESKTAAAKETDKVTDVRRKTLGRKRKHDEDKEMFMENTRQQRRIHRENEKINCGRPERLIKFRHAVKYGAIFVCSSCHQRLFENGVTLITQKFKEEVETKKPGLYEDSVEEIEQNMRRKPGSYICHTCKETLKKGRMPCLSIKNGLSLFPLADPDMKLSEIENNLIAQNILFQKIFLLPKSRMSAVKDRLVNVPVSANDIINTVTNIPRTPREAGLIQVKLKRRLKYKNYHRHEFISPEKIFKMLEYLKKSGHPYYQFYDDINTYHKRCTTQKINGAEIRKQTTLKFVSDAETKKMVDLRKKIKLDDEDMQAQDSDYDSESDDEVQYVKNDPVRKFQFNHNASTCLTNKFPEMLLNDDGKEVDEDEDFAFAPGEGKIPKNILMDDDWDIKAWPSLHPDGGGGLHQSRNVRLSDQKYFVQRIRNKDRRFEENPGYVFAAASYIEKKQLQSNANISFSRGKKTKNQDGGTEYTLNDPFTVFENMKNTPKYWQKYKYEMIAKLENLGPFQWFFTLSCADRRWDENFSSLLEDRDLKLAYEVTPDGRNRTTVTFIEDRQEESMELHEYLEEKVDESYHEMIRTNVLNATRNFQHRVNSFIKEIMFGENNPMEVKNMSYKVEFQGRGAGHIHGVLWVNLSQFEGEEPKEFQYLTTAFRKLKEDEPLNDDEKKDLVRYVDKFITCSLNPDKLSEMVADGKKLAKLAVEVQQHSHTRTCHKYDDSCRFHKPTFPMKETTIFQKKSTKDDSKSKDIEGKDYPKLLEKVIFQKKSTKDDSESKEIEGKDYTKLLEKVKELLDDKEIIKTIMDKYNKAAESKEEYITNRNKRIDELLMIAGTEYEEYIKAIKCSVKQGHMILLERDIDEGYINAFNPEWLEAWEGNMDLQPCFDYFAVITYVTDYLTKDDKGVTAILREVIKNNGKDDKKEQMQALIHTFLTHRQMGQAEAYYKIIPNLNMKFSTVKTVYVPTDRKEIRSRFLLKVGEKEDTHDKIAFTVNGRDGMFIEKADLIDKYIRRPGPKNRYIEYKDTDPDTEDLVVAQFAKMMETSQKKELDEDNEPLDYDDLEFNKDDDKFHYIMTADDKKKQDRTLLPQYMKLLPKYPGENNIMRKRRFPAAIRFNKKRQDVDTHKYFLSELMLYYPFRDEIKDLHSDNEELCAQLYQKEIYNIKKVKMQVMEHLENVEEARYMVEEYLKNQAEADEMGTKLDPEKEQEIDDCEMEDEESHPDFVHLDPNDMAVNEKELIKKEKVFKRIEIGNIEDLRLQTQQLDSYQKYIIELAIRYSRGIVKSLKPKNKKPIPPVVMVHGGAGSGKSTVINAMSRWVHFILQSPGDDPDCPYIIISAYTGAAACNVNGQTLHSLFSFNFGSAFLTMSDKVRDQKRQLFKNLQVLIIDEVSLVDSDMLYKIDLRLKEVKQNDKLFGGVALFCFGDLLQIKPVKGRYIFQAPKCEDFKLANAVQPHWKSFKIVNLEENHRQGNDKTYAEILNRIRTGQQTESDILLLEKRVRPKNHPDLKDKDAIYLFGKNKPVDEMNEKRLLKIKGEEYIIEAKCFFATMKDFKPPVSKTGTINNTPFQAKLRLKINAKVMLTYNVDTADGLTNGSRGELLGVIKNEQNDVKKLIIKLENPSHGQMNRELNPDISKSYPGCTLIEKVSFGFSLSKSNRGNIASARVIQFPVKLAFAATAHKIQGQTVKKPRKVVVDLRSVFQPAMAYVMLSRVESIEQLFILEDFVETKVYGNKDAIEELEKMNKISINEKPSSWFDKNLRQTRISVLNCGSIRPQHSHITKDSTLTISDAICLTETWIWTDEDTTRYELEGFTAHHNAAGRGKGVSVYYKKDKFTHIQDIKEEKVQLTKMAGKQLDLIIVYKAPAGNDSVLKTQLQASISFERPTLVCGDFNMCFIENRNNRSTQFLTENGFKQVVHDATHIEGGHIDHVYIWDLILNAELYSPYYTAKDHDALCISIPETEE